jgi:prepilin-type N-terminal cleavage/methylation domain-containing protein
MRRSLTPSRLLTAGFTLVELAVVLAIVSFLLLSLMYTLSAQTEQRSFEETRRRLDQARELVIAFAIVKGRLPCPATAASAADEAFTGANCTNPYDGWLPAKPIGYQQVDSGGYAIDAWGNRIRYAVANLVTNCSPGPPTNPHFVNTANLKANGLACQPNDLIVCKSATGITATACGGSANQIMTQDLVSAIIFSTGKNFATAPDSATALGAGRIDEAANLNGDRVFVFHTPTPSGAANGEFDDQLTWIPVGELYGKLIAAGVLP